ncbi:MAG: MFS transporter [Ruminococcaceae bacterium]|nr:MFS transporter [Oscillospiraceae bacterium]
MNRNIESFERNNIVKSITITILSGILTLFSGGVLWQSMLLYYGISNTVIGTLGSIATFSQIIAMIMNIFVADRIKNPIKIIALCSLSGLLYFPVIIITFRVMEGAILAPVLFTVIFIYNIFTGISGVISYKLPYLIYKIENYGRVVAVQGVISNIFTTVLGIAAPIIIAMIDYETAMLIMYIVCAIVSVITTLLYFSMKVINKHEQRDQEGKAVLPKFSLKKLFIQDNVRVLFMPNLLRGISSGIIGSVALFAAKMFDVTASDLSVIATLGTAAAIIGSLIFSLLGKKNVMKYLCLVSCIIFGICAILMPFSKSFIVFLVLYTILMCFSIIVDGTIPVLMTYFIPYEEIGVNTSLRLIITYVGTMVSQSLTGIILDLEISNTILPIIALLVTAGVTRFVTGYVYYRYSKKCGT